MPLLISINWPSLVTSWIVVQKIYSEMYLVSCANTHCDITDSVNHGTAKNTKAWISSEQNIIFLRNQKILNLCLSWHILRSYRFVAEVTFKMGGSNYGHTKNEGFILNSLLLCSKQLSQPFANYHDDMNAVVFKSWFGNTLVSNLPIERKVITAMDNAKHHSRLVEK